MSRSNVWMPFFIGDYLRDTAHLTASEHGAYMLLLMHAWTRGGSLPADEKRLQVMACTTGAAWKRSRDTLLAFFTRDGDTYRQKRIDHELAVSKSISEQRSIAGRASAEARKKHKDDDPNGSGIPANRPRDRDGGGNGAATSVQRQTNERPTAEATNEARNFNPLQLPPQKKDSFLDEVEEAQSVGARATEVPLEPPMVGGKEAFDGVVVSMKQQMKMRAYGPGQRPIRDPQKQISAVEKSHRETKPIAPETLALIRAQAKKTA